MTIDARELATRKSTLTAMFAWLSGLSDSQFAVAASGEYCEDVLSAIVGSMGRGLDLIEAQSATIESLNAEVEWEHRAYLIAHDQATANGATIERLKGAISWIEPPFVDDQTSHDELRQRVGFAVKDAALATKGGVSDDQG